MSVEHCFIAGQTHRSLATKLLGCKKLGVLK
ncbi:unnamed protein product, partial [marine sediment metagenome]